MPLEDTLLSRRRLLHGASSLALASLGGAAHAGGPRPDGLIPRSQEPANLEFPFASLDSFLVPNDLFYVRNHFAQPLVEARSWRLEVTGAVRNPFSLDYDALRRLPRVSRPVLLECAGNGRSFLEPKTPGVQWELGAVGTASWTGVPLSELLRRAGVRNEGLEVIFEGIDAGEVAQAPERVHFARSVPLEKARRDVLLAYEMNGKELPPAHGFPVRAIVPGWFGVSSVKWLRRIVVTDRPFRGYFQSVDYTYWVPRNGISELQPLTELQVKAQIARPTAGQRLPAGRPTRIFGAAWTGESDVSRVEVSTDAGRTWHRARFTTEPRRFAWRFWEYEWTPTPGSHALLARARDAAGRLQPAERDRGRRNYMISHSLPVAVTAG